jgi:hypothetical protein
VADRGAPASEAEVRAISLETSSKWPRVKVESIDVVLSAKGREDRG